MKPRRRYRLDFAWPAPGTTCRVLAWWCAVIAAAGAISPGARAFAAEVDSLDDIAYWTGAGANRAALAIDFDGDSTTDHALVWGFRWDGAATGRDMLDAIVASDPRLFARIGDSGPQLGGVMGLGYDRSDDGSFAITVGGPFDAEGFAYGAPNEADAQAVDPADRYREGWFDGFWHYGIAAGNPYSGGQWTFSRVGASTRPLSDGDWDSWAFTIDADHPAYYSTIFARNPVIATPPGGHADFDGDGDVDGGDFVAWQRGAGLAAPTPSQGDANGNGAVDGADLAVWRRQFGLAGAEAPLAIGTAPGLAVPEPLSLTTCASAMFALFRFGRLPRSFTRRKAS